MKAIGLFSGGLDSILAIKLIQEQGIEVVALNFLSPFFGNVDFLKKSAEANGINLEILDISNEFLELLKNPKHGFGKNMNPCIDCKIFMIKKAAEYAKRIDAKFVFTGEVFDQRPMSQRHYPLGIIEEESGLKGRLLRPLSAKLLKPTELEIEGVVDRDKLEGIRGRRREKQLILAKKYDVKEFSTPSGGCLLTCEGYCEKLRFLIDLEFKSSYDVNDIFLLKVGRHFYNKGAKIIVGKSKEDNDKLVEMKKETDVLLECKDFAGPIVLLRGNFSDENLELAANLCIRYSKADKDSDVLILNSEKVLNGKFFGKNFDFSKYLAIKTKK